MSPVPVPLSLKISILLYRLVILPPINCPFLKHSGPRNHRASRQNLSNLILYLDFLECTMAKSSRFIEVEKIQMSDAEIIGDCHRKNTRTTNDGSAYPECNKTGEWKSVKHNRQMINRRANEIRKLQGRIAKCVASAAGKRKKKKKRVKK